jgi:transposase
MRLGSILFVIARKSWLFNHNHRGAEASAILYNIIETA